MSAPAIVALCRHIKTNGHRCQSPAIKGTSLCYFHRRQHTTHRRPQSAESLMSTWQEEILDGYRTAEIDPLAVARAYPKQNEFHFPALEDAESIQLATSMLFQAIATGQIHFRRAKLLLSTLKIATMNVRAVTTATRFTPDNSPIPTRVVRTRHGHILVSPTEDEDILSPDQTIPRPVPSASETMEGPASADAANDDTTAAPDSQPEPSEVLQAKSTDRLSAPPAPASGQANQREMRDLRVNALDREFCADTSSPTH